MDMDTWILSSYGIGQDFLAYWTKANLGLMLFDRLSLPVRWQEVDSLQLATQQGGMDAYVNVFVCVWKGIKQGYVAGREPGLAPA